MCVCVYAHTQHTHMHMHTRIHMYVGRLLTRLHRKNKPRVYKHIQIYTCMRTRRATYTPGITHTRTHTHTHTRVCSHPDTAQHIIAGFQYSHLSNIHAWDVMPVCRRRLISWHVCCSCHTLQSKPR